MYDHTKDDVFKALELSEGDKTKMHQANNDVCKLMIDWNNGKGGRSSNLAISLEQILNRFETSIERGLFLSKIILTMQDVVVKMIRKEEAKHE